MPDALIYAGLLDNPEDKRAYNRRLFRVVAPSYHLITRVLSWGRDRAWKRGLVASLPPLDTGTIVDLACGTADITFLLAARFTRAHILGLDICPEMVRAASRKNRPDMVTFALQDMGNPGLRDGCADMITGGYALRNAPDLHVALREVHRILKPGGTAVFLDFSKPRWKPLQILQLYILRFWAGLWGLIIHRNPRVYTYIAASLAQYPDRVGLRAMLRGLDFADIRCRLFMLGFVEQISFRKPVR